MRASIRELAVGADIWFGARYGKTHPDVIDKVVEDRLRTYIANGTTPEELKAAVEKDYAEAEARASRRKEAEIEDMRVRGWTSS